jgi:endonuclease/exonuclease/phosphatase family metal-dependent hydrolase
MVVEPARAACRQTTAESTGHVTWIRPSAPRDRARLDRWCDAVGPLVVEPTPRTAPAAADRLAVVVWNVHVGGGDVDRLIDALRRGDLTSGVPIAAFALLLQETYRDGEGVPVRPPAGSRGPRAIRERPPGGVRRGALEIAHAHGLAVVYAPSMRNAGMIDPSPRAEDRGNAILSSLPMTDPTAIELPFERQRRVVVAATIAGRTTGGADWRLRLADAHLDTTIAITRGGPFAARRRQAAAIVEALAASAGATLLGGDFNTWLGDREAAAVDLRAVFPQTPAGSLRATWHGPLGSHAALDHVFVRDVSGAVTVARVADRFGSDHDPLLAVVQLR